MPSQFTYKPDDFSSQNKPENAAIFQPLSTGKEKDSETGYYYFGARYYNSDLSIWLSVDPMGDKYPSLSPYNYCAWNPMKIVDPDGREIGDFYDSEGNYIGTDGKNDGMVYLLRQTENSFDSKPGPNGEEACVNYITKDELSKTIEFIKNHDNTPDAFSDGCIAYNNSIGLEEFSVMKAMVNTCIGHSDFPQKEIGGVVDCNGKIDRIAAGTENSVQIKALPKSDRCWFHCHLPNKKRHGGYNESILDRNDRYHAPSWNDTQQYSISNPSFKGYVFDTQNGRTYVIQGGKIQGYIKTSTFK